MCECDNVTTCSQQICVLKHKFVVSHTNVLSSTTTFRKHICVLKYKCVNITPCLENKFVF